MLVFDVRQDTVTAFLLAYNVNIDDSTFMSSNSAILFPFLYATEIAILENRTQKPNFVSNKQILCTFRNVSYVFSFPFPNGIGFIL